VRRIRPPDGLIPSICVMLGLASISAAGFVIALWLGLVLVGLSLGAMAWLREMSERKS
jgi:hypothetical protein